ncbi:MAG: hypothetical protein WKF82_04640 [Nocardioidaceae bacterium]
MPNAAEQAAGPQVEQFAASSGRLLGLAMVVLAAALVVVSLLGDFRGELGLALCAIAAALLSWVVLVRPRVALHQHGVVLRNILRDTFVPAAQIERCRVFQTLQITTPEDRFHGVGVSRSVRSMVKDRGGAPVSMGGIGPVGGAMASMPRSEFPSGSAHAQAAMSSSAYIESRIMNQAQTADPDDRQPVVAWAHPAVAALTLAVILIALVALLP